jgi:hypothetical protein
MVFPLEVADKAQRWERIAEVEEGCRLEYRISRNKVRLNRACPECSVLLTHLVVLKLLPKRPPRR